jgi:hypothetical protein|tara:strand:+ start:3054 stop:3437 length:384 start_codon:yes stop_codon:yes gene_type:complete
MRPILQHIHCLLLLFLLTLASSANAEQAQAVERVDAEINYLLRQVKTTECAFNRNGSRHKGAAAVAHIQRKYDYYEDDIETAEDFIRLSASKSTMTRRAYTIECPEQSPVTSASWLLEQLAKYRQGL